MFEFDIEKIKEQLKQISKIVAIEKIRQEEKRKRGELFNIFSILRLSTHEVRLHSAFLAELLNPEGNHGLDDKFLEAFLINIIQQVKPDFEFDTKSAKVRKELWIGPISENYTEGGQIDLLIRDDKNHAIVIENKINADDEKKQLLRYQNFAKKNFQEYILLYLTLDGKEASEYSTDNKVNYERINYKDDILSWLNQCIIISVLFPKVREIIAQYITNLKQITNIMNEENQNELIELLKKNTSAAVSVLEVEEEIKREVRRNYINQVIRKIAERNSFKIVNDFNDFLDMRNDSVVILKPKEKTTSSDFGSFVLCMYSYGKTHCVYYGIKVDNYYKNKKGELVWSNDKNSYFPFGWQYINNEGDFCYWNNTSTIAQMQKEIELSKDKKDYPEGIIAQEIEDALKKVNEKSLFEQLDKICKE
ncbi:MAG: PD-(D/E)XK nuclease family protein [Muribaculaceae bacterium]|nr:PD-(D/E)XK nuclease family protein [Muribaculaceae bacterium]